MNHLPERFTWAASIMRVHTRHKILEIGCGAGLLVQVISEQLSGGSITALDRSAPMIKLAAKRNREGIEAGKVTLINSAFMDAPLPAACFNKVVAFNVNFFQRSPEKELALIRKILKPSGTLYIFDQAPVEIDKRSAGPVIRYLEANAFRVADTLLQKMKPTSVRCIICNPLKK